MADDVRRILVVGGLGYIGSRLSAALSEDSHVVVTSRALTTERCRWLDGYPGRIERVVFDSAVQTSLPTEGRFDCVINLAAPSATEAAKQPAQSLELALRTVRACLELVETGRAARMIHFSTFHVYGAHRRATFYEDDAPSPTHPYGEIHMACERAMETATTRRPVFIVRPTNIVGAPAHADLGVQSTLVFLDLCAQSVRNGEIALHNNGRSYRDFVPMSDALAAVGLLMKAPYPGPAGRILNLSSATATRLDSLAHQIQHGAEALTGHLPPVKFGDKSDQFTDPFQVSNRRLRAFGWECRGPLDDEIRETLRFFIASES